LYNKKKHQKFFAHYKRAGNMRFQSKMTQKSGREVISRPLSLVKEASQSSRRARRELQ
jgi:hypothetical protein